MQMYRERTGLIYPRADSINSAYISPGATSSHRTETLSGLLGNVVCARATGRVRL